MTSVEGDDSTESAFQKALSKWRDLDLSSLQTQLEKQGMEIIESQKDFLVERKELSTKTKMFRKLPDDEKLVQVMSLLKGFILRGGGTDGSVSRNN
jgi:homeobox protein cut-like